MKDILDDISGDGKDFASAFSWRGSTECSAGGGTGWAALPAYGTNTGEATLARRVAQAGILLLGGIA